jgi:retron-type reverse transcriptase
MQARVVREPGRPRFLQRKEAVRAPAVRRVHIPKPGKAKKVRPVGIPTLEDKVLQRAMLMVLEPVFEQDFPGCP